MTLALRRPELLRDIIPVDNAPIDAGLISSFGAYTRAMKEIDRANLSRHADADKILEAYEPSLPVRQFLLGNLHRVRVDDHHQALRFRVPVDILAKALDKMGDFPYKDPQVARFEKPALFVRGSHSKYVPDEALPVIGQFFPLFQLADVDAGHWLISEQPEQFRQGKHRPGFSEGRQRQEEPTCANSTQPLSSFFHPKNKHASATRIVTYTGTHRHAHKT